MLAFPLLLLLAAGTAGAARSDSSAIRQVDHVVIGFADPAAAFSFFKDTLGIPMAWPLADVGPFRTSGVSVGNMNIELGRIRERAGVPMPRVSSILFEPTPLPRAVAALNALGIAHGEPVPMGLEPNAPPDTPGWTTVMITPLTNERINVVLCEYTRPNMPLFRAGMADSLRARHGGPLGVLGAAAIVVGTGGDSSYALTWRRLLGMTSAAGVDSWPGGGGPAIRFDHTAPRGAAALLLRVRSLADADRALTERRIAHARRGGEIRIESPTLGGADVRLVE